MSELNTSNLESLVRGLIQTVEDLKKSANSDAKRSRLKIKELEERLGSKPAQAQEPEEPVKAKPGPKPKDPEVERLRQENRNLKHKDVFARIARESNVRPEALDALWQVSGYQATDDVADEEAIKATIAEVVGKQSFFLSAEPSAPAPAPSSIHPGPGVGRGDPAVSTGSFFTVKESDLNNMQFMRTNQERVTKASTDGTLKIIPG